MKNDVILSLQCYTFRDRSFAETLQTARRLGFANVESYPGQPLGGGLEGTTDYRSIKPETILKLRELVAKSGVKMVSYGVTGAKDAAEWTKLMEFCRTLGVKFIQIEAGLPKEALDLAEDFAKRYGIRVSLHNHWQPGGMPKPMAESLQGRGPMIGAGADIGHWVRGGENALAGVKLLKGKFVSIHLGDVSDKASGHRDLPLGSGVVDVKGVLDELAAQGGTIYATIEYEASTASLEADVAACVRYFRAWERDEIDANNGLRVAALAGLWRDVARTGKPDLWEIPANANDGAELGRKTAQMKRLPIDESSITSDAPGIVEHEGPKMAFGDDPKRKYNRFWKKGAFVACGLREAGTVKVYTVSSSNDAPMRDPAEWILHGSEDGTNWFELDHRKDQLFLARFLLKGYAISQPRSCRFLKLEFLGNSGGENVQFSRLGFFE